MTPRRLLILKTGDTVPEVAAIHGDYDAMFLAILDGLDVQAEVVQAHRGPDLPSVDDVDMAIITGSPHSVTEPEPWVEALAQWSRQARAADRPVLGVCYGHQLLAYAEGGAVQVSPLGFEMGTIGVQLTEEGRRDPILGPMPQLGPLDFNSMHGDEVVRLPPGAVHLAENAHSRFQAFRLGDHTWGVQFHPEFTRPIMEIYVEARADRARALAQKAGLDPEAVVETARRSLIVTPAGPRLLERFVRHAKTLLDS